MTTNLFVGCLRTLGHLFLVCLVASTLGCDEQIVHDLSEHDANRVVSRLSSAALQAHKVRQSDGRWAIEVSSDAIVPALAFLESNRVLIARGTSSAPSKGGIVPSRQEQWFRYERAMALSIEESLGAIAGVLEARVHLNLPETDPLFGTSPQGNTSGSVLLLIDSHYAASNEEIASLVGGAAGIPVSQVTVLKSFALPPPETAPRPDLGKAGVSTEMVNLQYERSEPESRYHPTFTIVGCVMASIVALAGVSTMHRRKKRQFTFHRLDSRDSEE